MIRLDSDCLLFQMQNGESVPLSPEMICVELTGDHTDFFDTHFVQHAAKAVFHYFKHDLGRLTVTVGEFAEALETVLRGFGVNTCTEEPAPTAPSILESDLRQLATESGKGCELFFFPRLRDEMRHQLRLAPRMLRLRGLRGCVKHLAGARRWSNRCQTLHDQIVEFIRECAGSEPQPRDCALIVE